jgi:hypothetical protein
MQDDTLSGVISSVDVATTKNLDDLVKVGEALLKKPVSRVNPETGIFEAANHETNEEALKRYQTIKILPFFFANFHFDYQINIMEIITLLQVCKTTFPGEAASPC